MKPELKKDILKFGYVISYKYEGILAHSINKFYVITKFATLNFDDKCEYLQEN